MVVVFTIEVVLKLWAFGITQFFRQVAAATDHPPSALTDRQTAAHFPSSLPACLCVCRCGGQAENTIDALVMGAAFMSLLVYGFSAPHSALHRSVQLANLCLLFLAFRGVRLFPKCDIFAKFQCAFKVSHSLHHHDDDAQPCCRPYDEQPYSTARGREGPG